MKTKTKNGDLLLDGYIIIEGTGENQRITIGGDIDAPYIDLIDAIRAHFQEVYTHNEQTVFEVMQLRIHEMTGPDDNTLLDGGVL